MYSVNYENMGYRSEIGSSGEHNGVQTGIIGRSGVPSSYPQSVTTGSSIFSEAKPMDQRYAYPCRDSYMTPLMCFQSCACPNQRSSDNHAFRYANNTRESSFQAEPPSQNYLYSPMALRNSSSPYTPFVPYHSANTCYNNAAQYSASSYDDQYYGRAQPQTNFLNQSYSALSTSLSDYRYKQCSPESERTTQRQTKDVDKSLVDQYQYREESEKEAYDRREEDAEEDAEEEEEEQREVEDKENKCSANARKSNLRKRSRAINDWSSQPVDQQKSRDQMDMSASSFAHEDTFTTVKEANNPTRSELDAAEESFNEDSTLVRDPYDNCTSIVTMQQKVTSDSSSVVVSEEERATDVDSNCSTELESGDSNSGFTDGTSETTVRRDNDECDDSIDLDMSPFWYDDPKKWFAELDFQFKALKIKDDHKRFTLAASYFPRDLNIEVLDEHEYFGSKKIKLKKYIILQRIVFERLREQSAARDETNIVRQEQSQSEIDEETASNGIETPTLNDSDEKDVKQPSAALSQDSTEKKEAILRRMNVMLHRIEDSLDRLEKNMLSIIDSSSSCSSSSSSFSVVLSAEIPAASPVTPTVDRPMPTNSETQFYVTDEQSGIQFLVDTSSFFSTVPRELYKNIFELPKGRLFEPDNTSVMVHGVVFISIDIGLAEPLFWEFFVTEDPVPRIGRNLLYAFNLCVDKTNKCLVEKHP